MRLPCLTPTAIAEQPMPAAAYSLLKYPDSCLKVSCKPAVISTESFPSPISEMRVEVRTPAWLVSSASRGTRCAALSTRASGWCEFVVGYWSEIVVELPLASLQFCMSAGLEIRLIVALSNYKDDI